MGPKGEVFTLSPSACPAQCASPCFHVSFASAVPLASCSSPFHTKAKNGLGGSEEGATCGSGAALCYWTLRFWHPVIGQSVLERNCLEGLINNQRKGARTVAVCPLLAPLPPFRRQRCAALVSGARLVPFQSSPQEPADPGLPPSWQEESGSGTCMPCGRRRNTPTSPSPDNPTELAQTLALGAHLWEHGNSRAPRGWRGRRCVWLSSDTFTQTWW